jgi:acetoin utilization deacetylase AcuC-like enzyme
MMRLYTHADCLQHAGGLDHAERPARLRAVLQALDHDRFAALDRILAHAGDSELHALDEDTWIGPGSVEAARRAAGAVAAAVDAVIGGQCEAAFCAVRPPGHHATRDEAMGFCLFNNVAVGAAQAFAVHGLKRVAIADFDVHHGNGTQAIFEREQRVLFLSSHQSPLYPSSGAEDECGVGNIVNGTLSPGAGSLEFRELWTHRLLPRLHAFKPQLVLVSAGFDAHRQDPLADLRLGQEDYAWITDQLQALARRHAGGRIVSTLEGGYDLAALAASTAAHVEAMLD